MRNALARAPAQQRTAVAALLKTIFAQESKADAEARRAPSPTRLAREERAVAS